MNKLGFDKRRASTHSLGVKKLLAVAFLVIPTVAVSSSLPASADTVLASWQSAVARALSTPCSPASAAPTGVTINVGIADFGAARTIVAGVCIAGNGPFPFVVDTGSSVTYVGAGLANDLSLANNQQSFRFGPVGCATKSTEGSLTSWSVDGIALDPQSVVIGKLGSAGPGLSFDGLLGADVLARFGAVRVDYKAQTLSTANSESSSAAAQVQAGAHPPTPFDTTFSPIVDAPMHVLSVDGFVQPTTSVTIKGKPRKFIVDTGAALVDIGPKLAAYIGLHPTVSEKLTSTNCGAKVSSYIGGNGWTLDGVPLARQEIDGVPVAGANFGLLGSTVLSAAGAAVFDFADGRLLLTASAAGAA